MLVVPLHVQCQVVGAGETAVAVATFERLCACVFPVVTGQLVRPREPPFASLPRALVWLLACKHNDIICSLILQPSLCVGFVWWDVKCANRFGYLRLPSYQLHVCICVYVCFVLTSACIFIQTAIAIEAHLILNVIYIHDVHSLLVNFPSRMTGKSEVIESHTYYHIRSEVPLA